MSHQIKLLMKGWTVLHDLSPDFPAKVTLMTCLPPCSVLQPLLSVHAEIYTPPIPVFTITLPPPPVSPPLSTWILVILQLLYQVLSFPSFLIRSHAPIIESPKICFLYFLAQKQKWNFSFAWVVMYITRPPPPRHSYPKVALPAA